MVDRRLSINDINLPPDVIKGYTLEGLKELSNQDEGSFYEFFQGLDLEDVKLTQQRRERIQDQNRELAVETCALQPQFEELKSELQQKSAVVDDLKDSYLKKYEELKIIQKRRDDNALKAKLVQATKDAEKSSEDMASDFIAGKSEFSADEFKDRFFELRQTYWMRKVKTDKFEELLKNQRPTPAPRVPRTQPPQPNVQDQNPAQSLPAHMQHHAPYPAESRRTSEPISSMPPPYSVGSSMPMPRLPPPGHPFSSIPPSYGHQPGPSAGYPARPPPRPGHGPYASYGHRY